jgi:hypothetical protein
MSGRPRGDVIQEDRVGVYHVWDRTVRRAWLCGVDERTGIQEGDEDYVLSPLNEHDRAPLLGPPEAESVIASKQCDLAVVNPGAVQKLWRHGFLPLALDDYLDLLDCVGRQIIAGKVGAIDARLEPILLRLGLAPSKLFDLLENFDCWMHGAVGCAQQMAAEAARTGRSWLHGTSQCRRAFTDGS